MQVSSTNTILKSNSQNNISQLNEKNQKDNSFNSLLDSNIDEKQRTKELLEELEFVAKTGFTKEQLKQIEELLDKLAQMRAQDGKSAQNIEEYIQNLKADLQYAVYKVTGKQMDFDEEMLDNFINSNKNQNDLLATTTDEELRLIEELKKG